jgi:hypothetical protein
MRSTHYVFCSSLKPHIRTTTMPSADRSAWRDVLLYDSNDLMTILGGLRVTNGVTNINFYSMAEILFILKDTFSLQDEDGVTVQKDGPLQQGNYYIHSICTDFLIWPLYFN